jgi:hypothetical protein
MWLVKTNALGDCTWSRTFGGTREDFCSSVRQTTDGGYILAGYTYSFGADSADGWLLRTNENGDSLWSRRFGGIYGDWLSDAQETPDGGYIAVGGTESFGAGNTDFWLLKTNAAGDLIWSRTFGGSGGDNAVAVQQICGGYVLSGVTGSFGAGASDFWLVATNAEGFYLWDRTFGGTSNETACLVQQVADGSYVLAGSTDSYGAGNRDFWLVKTGHDDNLVAPRNVIVRIVGDDAILNWTRDCYPLYEVQGAYYMNDVFETLGTTSDTTILLPWEGLEAFRFYQVRGILPSVNLTSKR